MITTTIRWFDRKFSFDDPVSIFPSIVERLRGTPLRAEYLVQNLPQKLLTRRLGDRWSIQEQIGHLLDLEELWIGRLDDFRDKKERLRPADLDNRKTHEAGHNQKLMENLLSEFKKIRGEFVGRIELLSDTEILQTSLHPRLNQPMRLMDSCLFVAEHDDHHLAKITELKREFLS